MKKFALRCLAAMAIGLAAYFILKYLGVSDRLAGAIGGVIGGVLGASIVRN